MRLEIRDPAIVAVAERATAGVAGVAGLHDPPWLHPARIRARPRGVDVARAGGGGGGDGDGDGDDSVGVTVRVVLHRGRPVIDVVRAVQHAVRDDLLRLTGLPADVVVRVVDLV